MYSAPTARPIGNPSEPSAVHVGVVAVRFALRKIWPSLWPTSAIAGFACWIDIALM